MKSRESPTIPPSPADHHNRKDTNPNNRPRGTNPNNNHPRGTNPNNNLRKDTNPKRGHTPQLELQVCAMAYSVFPSVMNKLSSNNKISLIEGLSSSVVSWPVSGVCRCPADILTSVRGKQVTCRYPDQCQGLAGTLQISWPVSGVCRCPADILTSVRGLQVPCRYPDQCQG